MRATRTLSGSSSSIAASTAGGAIPRISRSCRTWRLPAPRSASACALARANRSSSTAPAPVSRSIVAARVAGVMRAFARRASSSAAERSRLRRARAAHAIASCCRSSWRRRRTRWRSSSNPTRSPARSTTSAGSVRQGSPSSATSTRPRDAAASELTLRGNLFDGSLSLLLAGGAIRGGPRGKQPRRGDPAFAELRLDPLDDLVGRVGMFPQEGRGVLAPLPEPLLVEAEVRPRLLDDLTIEPGLEHGAFPGDPRAVDDVELGLFERRRDLVLDDLHADAVADRLDPLLQGLDATDVEPDRRVELQRAAARSRLGRAEHDADLLAQLVREERDRVGAVQRAGGLAQALAHQPGLEADVAVAHLSFDLGLRRQGRDRVDGDDVERARTDQELGDLERLLAVVGLRDEQLVDVDTDPACVLRIHRVLRVDERADPTAALRLGDHVVDERRLPGRFRAEYLDDAAARQPAHSESEVERERSRRDRAGRDLRSVVHAHDRALAELALDLAECVVERLLAIHPHPPPSGTDSNTSYCAPSGRSRDM